MRYFYQLSLLLILSSLIFTTPVVAHQHGDGHRPRSGGGGHDFVGNVGHMDISGEIVVNRSVEMRITVTPDETVRNHHEGMMYHEEYSNQIVVRLTKLIEFEDYGLQGYDENDTLVSTFLLKSNTLDEPIIIEKDGVTEYHINSTDGVISIIVEKKENSDVSHGWKWSFSLTYPFQSNSSHLGLIQELETTHGSMMMGQNHYDGHMRLNESRIKDRDSNLPMYFGWDQSAMIDGFEQNVLATQNETSVVLALSQGDNIFYDPEIGVELDQLEEADAFFNQFKYEEFWNTINSPSFVGIMISTIMIGILIIISYWHKVR